MRTIRISDDVWIQILMRRKLGESPDAVLRRVFQMLERSVELDEKARSRMARRARLSHAQVRRRRILLRK